MDSIRPISPDIPGLPDPAARGRNIAKPAAWGADVAAQAAQYADVQAQAVPEDRLAQLAAAVAAGVYAPDPGMIAHAVLGAAARGR